MLFVVQVLCDVKAGSVIENEESEPLESYLVHQRYVDVFPMEILALAPHREIHFSIGLAPGVAPTSKEPYRMSSPKLVEPKLQLKEMLDKGYLRLSVS